MSFKLFQKLNGKIHEIFGIDAKLLKVNTFLGNSIRAGNARLVFRLSVIRFTATRSFSKASQWWLTVDGSPSFCSLFHAVTSTI